MTLVEEIREIVLNVTKSAGKSISDEQFIINDLGVPHKPEVLKKSYFGVYIFIFNGKVLKIGKVGPNSNARFFSQHYSPNSAPSTLAASILKDKEMKSFNLTDDNVGDWIKKNCQRVDIFLSPDLPDFTNELIETALHYRFQPKYEGFNSQRK